MREVVQFSTGNVGQHALKAIIGRPDLELVGVHAASPNKVGRDAAELCGLSEPTGIVATDDIDALGPDCVVYTAQAETRPVEAIEQLTRMLAAGIDVVGSSMVWLVTPGQADEWLRGPLEKACREGNSSLYVNGIDPGYSGDTEVYSALSLVTRAESIIVQEIFDYANYDDFEFTGKSMGFGLTADEEKPMLFLPGVLTTMWAAQFATSPSDSESNSTRFGNGSSPGMRTRRSSARCAPSSPAAWRPFASPWRGYATANR